MYIGARSPARAEEAIADLKNATGKQALFLKIDLGSLKSVKAAAEELQRYVHCLFNACPGTYLRHAPERRLSCMLCSITRQWLQFVRAYH